MFTGLGPPMNRYAISFFLQKTKTLSLALPTSNSSKYCTQESKPLDISYDQIFLQRSTQNFEIRRRVPRVKKPQTDEIQKEHRQPHLSLSLSLYLSIRRCNVYFDVPAPVSLSLCICKHDLDPDQTRMVLRIECFVNLNIVCMG